MSARRVIAAAAVTAFSGGMILLSAPAQAAPYVGEDCDKVRGTIYCTTVDESGKSGKGWTTESSKKGSYQSSHPTDSSVTNPGGNEPPGKQ